MPTAAPVVHHRADTKRPTVPPVPCHQIRNLGDTMGDTNRRHQRPHRFFPCQSFRCHLVYTERVGGSSPSTPIRKFRTHPTGSPLPNGCVFFRAVHESLMTRSSSLRTGSNSLRTGVPLVAGDFLRAPNSGTPRTVYHSATRERTTIHRLAIPLV